MIVPMILLAGLMSDDAANIAGRWHGAVRLGSGVLRIEVNFASDSSGLAGTIDIREQGAVDLALTAIEVEAENVRFALEAAPGRASFRGVRRGDSISGGFEQGGVRGRFKLRRSTQATPTRRPRPYTEREIRVGRDDAVLAGTFSVPETPGPHPAVVLVTGSGPLNRDEEVYGFRPFLILADRLVRRGFAVLRYDARGVGGSTGETLASSVPELVDDVSAIMAFVRTQADVEQHAVGLIGHSQGGALAAAVAAREDVAFLVLLASPAIPGDALLLAQADAMGAAMGRSWPLRRASRVALQRVLAAARGQVAWDEVVPEMRSQLEREVARAAAPQRKMIADEAAFVDARVRANLTLAQSIWYRSFIDHDPAVSLGRVGCPVLALFGELDTQVPAAVNESATRTALARAPTRDVTIRSYPAANHLFQSAVTGSPLEYGGLEKRFVPELMVDIEGWLQRHARRPDQ